MIQPDTSGPAYITGALILASTAILACLDSSVAIPMIKDDGFIQIATVVVLVIVVMTALTHAVCRVRPAGAWLEASFILAVYCMREMDFHRLFTDEHVTRLRLYTRHYPLEHELIAGAVMIAFIFVTAHFLAVHARPFLAELKKRSPRAWNIVLWFMLLAGAQIIDKPKILRSIGPIKNYAEESMELGAALLMLFILLSFSPLRVKLFKQPAS